MWSRLTRPSTRLKNPTQRRQAERITSLLIVLLLLGGMTVGVSVANGDVHNMAQRDLIVRVDLAALLLFLTAYTVSRSRWYVWGGLLGLAVTFAGIYLSILLLPDAADLVTFLVLTVLLSSVMFSPRVTLVTLVVTLAGIALLPFLIPSLNPSSITYEFLLNVFLGIGILLAAVQQKRSEDEVVQFRQAVETSGEVIFLTDRQGVMTYVNPEFTRTYGYSSDEVVGKTTPRILKSGKHAPEAYTNFWNTILGKQVARSELINKTQDGRLLTIAGSANPILGDTGEIVGFIAIQRDITRRKQAQQALRESEERLRWMVQASEDLIVMQDLDGRYLYYNGNPAYRVEPEQLIGKTPYNFHERAYADSILERIRTVAATGKGLTTETEMHWEGRTLWFSDYSYPVRDDQGNIVAVATISRNITDHKRAEQEIQRQARELAVVAAVSARLRQVQSADEIWPAVFEATHNLVQADVELVALVDSERTRFEVPYVTGPLQQVQGRQFGIDNGLSGHVLSTRRSFVTESYAAHPLRLDMPESAGIGPAVCVPLQSEVELLGTLFWGRVQGERPDCFAPGEVHLLAAIGEMAGNTLRRVRLYEDAQRRLEQTQALHDIDLAITSSLDLNLTLQILLQRVTEQMGVDAAAVLLQDPYSLTLRYRAVRGFRTRTYERFHWRPGDGLAGKVAARRVMVRHSSITEDDLPVDSAPLFAEEGFRAYVGIPLIAKGQLEGVLEILHRAPLDRTHEWYEFLQTLATQTAIAIENTSLFEGLQRYNTELVLAYDTTLEGWSRALDLRDKETEGHSLRVTEYTEELARQMQIPESEIIHIRRGALLHDIGKVGIPDSILLKPEPLTEDEWTVMHKHPVYAHELLSPIAYLRPAIDIPYCHHEMWDGSGYPRGLKGEQIPLAARIFAVADVWDALRSNRPYRQAWSKEQARDYVVSHAGRQFDPQVVAAFTRLVESGHW